MREIEPTTLAQGEHLEWQRTFDNYPASLYTLEYRFAGPGTRFAVSCTADGDIHVADLTVSTSQAIGRYIWQAWATEVADSSNTLPIKSGFVNIKLGLLHAGTDVVDTRSANQILLDAIEAAISGQVDEMASRYMIQTPSGQKEVWRTSMQELLAAQKYYAGIVARENAAERARSTGKFGRRVDIRIRENR